MKTPDDAADDNLDTDLRDAFPAKWTEAHPPTPQATAELVYQSLISALADGNFRSLLALSKLDDEPKVARKACIQAAQIGSSLHDPSSARQAMPLAFKSDETVAAGIFQFFSARNPDQFDPQIFYFQKSASGWLWTPIPSADTREKLHGWVDTGIKHWPDQWQETLLMDSPILKDIDANHAPAKEEAQHSVEAWLDATRRGDSTAALSLVARLGDPRSGSIVLQNLGYEISGFRRSKQSPSIIGIYQGKTWTAVGVKIDQGGKSTYPLYPVIHTARGPRILAEIDLFAADNRSREFLNKAALERLEKFGSVSAASDLRALCTEHQANMESISGRSTR